MSVACVITDLSHSYSSITALDGVSLTVSAGGTTAVLGPNGSGKSTLFRVLAAMVPPQSGTVSVFGLDQVRHRSALRRRIGVVFQEQSLDGKLTVLENLRLHVRLFGMSASQTSDLAGEYLERFGLLSRGGSRVETLSGGQRRRLELVRALLHGPDMLVLDEPTAGLDPGTRAEFWELLLELQKVQPLTVLFTTHHFEEAESCPHVVILDNGRVVADGAPLDLSSEIGREMVIFKGSDLSDVSARLDTDFGTPSSMVGGELRAVADDGTALATRVKAAFGDRITSVRIRKTALEDVYSERTGKLFNASSGTN
jgi:ABC-2 type transport system ATP-binding protein